MSKYAVRLVLVPAAPVTTAQADALIDLLTPDGGERADVRWEGEALIVEATIERRDCLGAIVAMQATVSTILPGPHVTELAARERAS